jgi:hypothetical protein
MLFVPRRSSFRSMVILGVREGNLYRLRGQPMRAMTNMSREIDEEEHVAPLVVRQVAPTIELVQREHVAQPVVRHVAPPITYD